MVRYYKQESSKGLLKNYRNAIIATNICFFFVVALLTLFVSMKLYEDFDIAITNFYYAIAVELPLLFISIMVSTYNVRTDMVSLNAIKREFIIKKIYTINDVEPGSGAMYIPILGSLFPKLWGQKMRQIERRFAITTDNIKYEVPLDLSENTTSITILFAHKSKLNLGVLKI